jgi:hypothetical protein
VTEARARWFDLNQRYIDVLQDAATLRCAEEHPEMGGTCWKCRAWADDRLRELNPGNAPA